LLACIDALASARESDLPSNEAFVNSVNWNAAEREDCA